MQFQSLQKPVLTTVAICFSILLHAQTNQWTWVAGDSALAQDAVTGTPGVAAPGNKPGARYDATSFTDVAGNLWLFSGDVGDVAKGQDQQFIDLWKFDVTKGWWTFVTGNEGSGAFSTVKLGGTGNGSANGTQYNGPGSREGSSAWADTSGNIWIFGGLGNPSIAYPGGYTTYLNDVWKYNISTHTWTWLTGDTLPPKPSVYGTKGVPSANNHPAGRYRQASWTDSSGNFWMFGGNQNNPNNQGTLIQSSDLWRYNTQTLTWTWIGGDNTLAHAGNYGTQGMPLATNNPGARSGTADQKDKFGNFWMFGGRGYDANNVRGVLNDLWTYNPVTNLWTWVSGSTQANAAGSYGTKGQFAPGNVPPARLGAKSWTDKNGNFWLFGGFNNLSYFNDLWEYDVANQQWAWMSGDAVGNAGTVYGIKGTTSPSNKPGARYFPVTWSDTSGNFWMMGGYGLDASGQYTNSMNDMWRYGANATLPLTFLNFDGILQNNTAALKWSTATEINNKGFEVQKSLDGQSFSNIGFVPGAGSSSTLHTYNFSDAKLLSGSNYYRLIQIDFDGKSSYSSILKFEFSKFDWTVLGNPSSNKSWVQLQLDKTCNVTIQILSLNGDVIQTINKGKIGAGTYSIPLNLSNKASGIYIVKLQVDQQTFSKKFLK